MLAFSLLGPQITTGIQRQRAAYVPGRQRPRGKRQRRRQKMSRANGGRRLDLKLHLSLPARGGGSSSSSSRTMLQAAPAEDDEESSPSSCVSSEGEQKHGGMDGALQWSDSPEATSMVLAACPRCFIYVMLAEADPRCPRCRCPVILDFLRSGDGNEHEGNSRRGATRNKSE